MQHSENNRWRNPPKRWTEFLVTLGIAVVPFLTLFFLIVARAGEGGELIWMGTVFFTVLALITCAIFALAGKPKIALGILAAILIGITGLVVSCSTVLTTMPAAQ